jgi:heparanase
MNKSIGFTFLMAATLAVGVGGSQILFSETPTSMTPATLLWRKMMGTTVLDAGTSPSPNLHLYAHCLRNHPGGVALLAINADRTDFQELTLPTKSERYTLTAKNLMDNKVELNGSELQVTADGDLPQIVGKSQSSGNVKFAPVSITFLSIPNAHNASCK